MSMLLMCILGCSFTSTTSLTGSAISEDTSRNIVVGTETEKSNLHVFGGAVVDGSVGIGTKDPSAKFEVAGGSIKATDGLIIEVRDTGKSCNPTAPQQGQMWLAASGCS